jgi:hypothetical protein
MWPLTETTHINFDVAEKWVAQQVERLAGKNYEID